MLHAAAGSLLIKKTLVALLSLLILVLPLSAFAESFTVTTNKDIYPADEKAIIVGVIPVCAAEGHAVNIRVAGPGGDCNTQTILPAEDNPFRSKPIMLYKCGLGEFTGSTFTQIYRRLLPSRSLRAARQTRQVRAPHAEENCAGGAEHNLERVGTILDKIWADLLDEGEEEEKIASDTNSTRQTYEAGCLKTDQSCGKV